MATQPLHLEILRYFHAEGLAGGTVVRAVAGFTGRGGVQTTSLVDAGGGSLSWCSSWSPSPT